ncbi:MAG: hypothetical protein RIQ33_1868 [Bacteroidota bacterium]
MSNLQIGSLNKLMIHFVGNKNNVEGVNLSSIESDFETTETILQQMVEANFKTDELFQFYFEPNLALNPVFTFVKSIFNDADNFIEQTINCTNYLYDKSNHPKIKSGEVYFLLLKNCVLENEKADAICIIKTENKESFLKVIANKNGFKINADLGVATHKIDKGCLIFNTQSDTGYKILITDNTSRGADAQYFKDDFLSVQPIKNDYLQTNQFLGIAKNYVTQQLAEEFEVSKADQIDLLNRSVQYFKTHDEFDKDDFENEVFQNNDIIKSFQNFDNSYRQNNDIEIENKFEISNQAVKKQARVFKSVLKLDKNFHIYIHGNRDLIEQGVEKDGRRFYKIYFNEEN